MIVRSYSRNKPCIRPEHIIRKLGAFHPKHPDFSSKPPGFSKQMPAIPFAEVED